MNNCKEKFASGLVLFIVIGSGMSAPSISSLGYNDGRDLQQRTKHCTNLMSFLNDVLTKHSDDMDEDWPGFFDWTSPDVQAPKYADYGNNFIDSNGRDLSDDFDSLEYNSVEDNDPYVESPYKYDNGPRSFTWSPYARTVPELPHNTYKNFQEHDYGYPPAETTVDIGWQNMQPSAGPVEIEEMIWKRRFPTHPPPLNRDLVKKRPQETNLKKANDQPPSKDVKFSVQRCFAVHSGENEGSYEYATDEKYLVFLVKKDQALTGRKPTDPASYPANPEPVRPTTGRPVQEQTTQGPNFSSTPPPALATTETRNPVTQAPSDSSLKVNQTRIVDYLTTTTTMKTTEAVNPTIKEPQENINLDNPLRKDPSDLPTVIGKAAPETSSPIDGTATNSLPIPCSNSSNPNCYQQREVPVKAKSNGDISNNTFDSGNTQVENAKNSTETETQVDKERREEESNTDLSPEVLRKLMKNSGQDIPTEDDKRTLSEVVGNKTLVAIATELKSSTVAPTTGTEGHFENVVAGVDMGGVKMPSVTQLPVAKSFDATQINDNKTERDNVTGITKTTADEQNSKIDDIEKGPATPATTFVGQRETGDGENSMMDHREKEPATPATPIEETFETGDKENSKMDDKVNEPATSTRPIEGKRLTVATLTGTEGDPENVEGDEDASGVEMQPITQLPIATSNDATQINDNKTGRNDVTSGLTQSTADEQYSTMDDREKEPATPATPIVGNPEAGDEDNSKMDDKDKEPATSATTTEEKPQNGDEDNSKMDDKNKEAATSAKPIEGKPETGGVPQDKSILNEVSEKEKNVEKVASAVTGEVQSQNLASNQFDTEKATDNVTSAVQSSTETGTIVDDKLKVTASENRTDDATSTVNPAAEIPDEEMPKVPESEKKKTLIRPTSQLNWKVILYPKRTTAQ